VVLIVLVFTKVASIIIKVLNVPTGQV